jgi:hypothetical protein
LLLVLAALVVAEIRRTSVEQRTIMDLGMRTGTDAAAFRALLRMMGWIALFLVMMGTVGFVAARIIFPGLYVVANLRWTGRQMLWVLVPIGLSAFVTLVVMDYAMTVTWPDPFIVRWLDSAQGVFPGLARAVLRPSDSAAPIDVSPVSRAR